MLSALSRIVLSRRVLSRGVVSRAVLAAVAGAGAAALCLSAAPGATAAPAAAKGVVVIVPGQQLYADAAANEQTFRPLADGIRAAGYRVVFAHAGGRDVAADAQLVKKVVDAEAAGADRVGIVAHSAGGLGTRHYLKFLGGSEWVDEYVAIGTAQYGSAGGCSQPRDGGYDTCMYADAIKKLNAGPDAPGPTRYSVVQSDGEWSDGRLDGIPQCRAYSPVPLANTGFDHVIEMRDPTIIRNVVTSLRGGCAGRVVTEPVDSIDWKSTLFPGIVGAAGDALRDAIPAVVPER
ncbi:esterase/lipase family protein [Gordonia paraffinivorans]|uniref:esterase/lipase family protein n=1 Tax=Gordonia paraffinivorans TaxID=175628 RepID=UPI001E55A460|nr:lipase [Gordonia paraffinivorans]MCD2145314.1 lipase [Gordonia paraffinivorans]